MSFKYLGFFALAALGVVALTGACSSKDKAASTGSGASCAPTDAACPAVAVKSDCLALVDNAGKDHFVLHLAQLQVTSPKALTTTTIKKVVGDGVNINLEQCNVPGKGTFTLITEFDIKAGTLKTGGAKPQANPADGYCYEVDAAKGVGPVDVKATFDANLKFSTDVIPKITLPVYILLDAKSVIYFPIHNAKLSAGQISADHNCIGSYNATKLSPNNSCLPELDIGLDFYTSNATLEGLITLEEADSVIVDLLGQSLCVLLSGDPSKYGDMGKPKKCTRKADGKIALEGDWCSTSNAADGCKDSYKLAATLAASSVKLAGNCK